MQSLCYCDLLAKFSDFDRLSSYFYHINNVNDEMIDVKTFQVSATTLENLIQVELGLAQPWRDRPRVVYVMTHNSRPHDTPTTRETMPYYPYRDLKIPIVC